MKIKQFVEDNQEALLALAVAVKELDTIRSVKDERELLGRQYAIEIMDGWLKQVFNIETGDLLPLVDEEDLSIVNYHEKVEHDE